MARPCFKRNHHVFFDNFFSSPVLLDHLLAQQTYACLTVRCKCKELPPCAKNKLREPGQTIARQRRNLLFTKWHDKQDVALLTTNVSPEEPSWTMQHKKNGRNIDIQKPRVSDVYTANMGGVDRIDQFRSYYIVGRQSRKWYRYIFWFLFNVAACNGYILECKHRRSHQWKRPQAVFWLELGKRLINNYSYWKWPANQVPAQEARRDHQLWFEWKAKRKNVYSANLLAEKPQKAIQWRWKISANSVVLHYVKCGASSSITVKTLEHWNSFYNLLFLIYWLSKTCKYTTETE